MSFSRYQQEIYRDGSSGQRPRRPVEWDKLERRAAQTLRSGPFNYIAGSAGREETAGENRTALSRVKIVPRMLRDVSVRSLARTVLGEEFQAPVILAPIGVQTMAHPDGELATARAAGAAGVLHVASSASSFPMEQIASTAPPARRWFQLYWPRSRELAASFIARAERAGYTAIVVTLDTWLLGWRPRDLTEAFLPFLWAEGTANYFSDPVFAQALGCDPDQNRDAAIRLFQREFANPSVTWADLAWLREQTSLPIIVKGIQHPDDGVLAVESGIDGVWVSNHGGRQVDGAIGSLDALGPVLDALAGRLPVVFDSGIRGGADALKALALGADLIALGRPYMYGLALGGEMGVLEVLRSLLAELELTMALAGCASIEDVGPELVHRAEEQTGRR